MNKTLYIGAKCVPSFYIGSGGSSEWASGVPFEPLTVVTYNDTWFISKKPVPADAEAPETGEYWAQVPGYVTEVTPEELQAILDDIEDLQEAVGDLDDLDTTAKTNLVSAVNEVKGETTELRDDLSDIELIDNAVKEALLTCFRHVLWKDGEDDYYSDLEDALYPDAIQSISASFVQGQYMFSPTDELDDLKPFLTVIAHRKDGTDETLNDYTLSGTLDASSSVITASYLTFSTTFTVTVKQLPSGYTKKVYIEANQTQYINTGITEVEAGGYSYKFKARPIIRDNSTRWLGHIFSALNYFAFVFRHDANAEDRFSSMQRWQGQPTATSYGTNSWVSGSDYVMREYLDGSDKIYQDDLHIYSCPLGTTKSASNIMYFLGYSGSPNRTDFRYSGRVYYFKMYELGTNVKAHDYMPCINSNNVVGIYDMVTDTFLSPAVGTLVAG